MGTIESFEDLEIWQLGMTLTEEVYRLTWSLPGEERYALGDQIRRAAVSIPSNIAEGYARANSKELHHFLRIATGSKAELQTQLLIGVRVGYFTQEQIDPLLERIKTLGRKINAFIVRFVSRAADEAVNGRQRAVNSRLTAP